MSQNCRLVYQFLLGLFLCRLRGCGDGALILESCIFIYLTEVRILVCSRFYSLEERGDSAYGLGLGCLLERRPEIMIGRIWVQALWVLDCCVGFGLEMWI